MKLPAVSKTWQVQSRPHEHVAWKTIGYVLTHSALERLIERMSRSETPVNLEQRPYDTRIIDSLGKTEYYSRGGGRKVRHG